MFVPYPQGDPLPDSLTIDSQPLRPSTHQFRSFLILTLIAVSSTLTSPRFVVAQTTAILRDADKPFPFRQKPIDYFGPEASDPVAEWISSQKAELPNWKYDPPQGYLLPLLKELKIPISSQVLVFSKTSANIKYITPRNPRAIYFNDDIYVGWVPGTPFVEISAVDPAKGAMFYTLKQNADLPARIAREESCLLCHASTHSLNVPGHLLKSFLTDNEGHPQQGYSRVSQNLPVEQRWGGWYVTGKHGRQKHLGNLSTAEDRKQHEADPTFGGNLMDIRGKFNAAKYPSADSDIVALLVLDHQTHLHNLITRVNYEERLQRTDRSEEQLLRDLLFVDAAPLADTVQGTSEFAAWFEKQGPKDKQGRSLRDLDLKTRLLKYRCSYLVYSQSVKALPAPVKTRLYRRLWQVLTGEDESPPFAKIAADERQTILEILRDTHRDLPDYWLLPD